MSAPVVPPRRPPFGPPGRLNNTPTGKRLTQTLLAVCPGTLRLTALDTAGATWIPAPGATDVQKAAAIAALAAFDWSDTAQHTWQNLQDRTAAAALLTEHSPQGKALRAVLLAAKVKPADVKVVLDSGAAD